MGEKSESSGADTVSVCGGRIATHPSKSGLCKAHLQDNETQGRGRAKRAV